VEYDLKGFGRKKSWSNRISVQTSASRARGKMRKTLFRISGISTEIRVLRKYLHLEAYKLSIAHGVERWIVCKPLSVKVFVTMTTQ
jgi:hypothetical protein